MLHNYAQMVRANEAAGFCWFSKETRRFFGSIVLKSSITPVPDGAYFVSSELSANDDDRRYTVRYIGDDGATEAISDFRDYETASQAKAVCRTLGRIANGEDAETFRWIVYLHQPMGGFEVQRVSSTEEAKEALYRWSRDVYVYEQASASLYPYSKEDWAEAKEYEEIGCPLDYPSKVMSFGPKGGIKVENA